VLVIRFCGRWHGAHELVASSGTAAVCGRWLSSTRLFRQTECIDARLCPTEIAVARTPLPNIATKQRGEGANESEDEEALTNWVGLKRTISLFVKIKRRASRSE